MAVSPPRLDRGGQGHIYTTPHPGVRTLADPLEERTARRCPGSAGGGEGLPRAGSGPARRIADAFQPSLFRGAWTAVPPLGTGRPRGRDCLARNPQGVSQALPGPPGAQSLLPPPRMRVRVNRDLEGCCGPGVFIGECGHSRDQWGRGTPWPHGNMSRAPKALVSKALEQPTLGASQEQGPSTTLPRARLRPRSGQASRSATPPKAAAARSASLVRPGGLPPVDLCGERPVEQGTSAAGPARTPPRHRSPAPPELRLPYPRCQWDPIPTVPRAAGSLQSRRSHRGQGHCPCAWVSEAPLSFPTCKWHGPVGQSMQGQGRLATGKAPRGEARPRAITLTPFPACPTHSSYRTATT